MINLVFVLFILRVVTIAILPSYLGLANVALFIALTFFSSIWIITKLKSKILTKYILLDLSIILVLVISLCIAMLNGLDPKDSIEAFLKFFILISSLNLGLICGLNYRNILYFKAIYYSLLLHVILGVILSKFGFKYEVHGVERITGLAGGVQIYANLISLLFVLSYFQLYYKISFLSKKVLIFSIMTCIVAFSMSNTLKNFAVSLAIIFVPYFFSKRKTINLSIFTLVIVVPMLIYLWPIIKELSLFDRIISVYDAGISTQLAPGEKLDSSLVWRLIHWKLLISDWQSNYMFLGSGVGQTVNLAGLKTAYGNGFEAHSDIVTFLIEFGVLLTPIISFILFYPLIDTYRKGRISSNVFCYTTLFVALSAFMASLFGNVFYSLANLYYLWFLIGWTIGKNEKESIVRHI